MELYSPTPVPIPSFSQAQGRVSGMLGMQEANLVVNSITSIFPFAPSCGEQLLEQFTIHT
eukprot:2594784-Amphidinium_carterae.1